MKTKKINVIVEGRISDNDMQDITGGSIYCQDLPPGVPTRHISNCVMSEGGDIISPPNPCFGSNVIPPCEGLHNGSCPTGYLNPPYCSPPPAGMPAQYISIMP